MRRKSETSAAIAPVEVAPDEPILFCGCVEQIAEATAAWRKRHVLWGIAGNLPADSIARAFASWQSVCGLTFAQVGPGENPDIVLTTGNIDGPGKVLAWSELPDGSDRQLTQKYDGERFVDAENPPRGTIDLVAVACHEIGHALGLVHAQPGTGDLMEPTYAPGRRVPQTGDVRRIQALYGPATGINPPATPAVPGAGKPIIIEIYGAKQMSFVCQKDGSGKLEVYDPEKMNIPGFRVVPA